MLTLEQYSGTLEHIVDLNAGIDHCMMLVWTFF